MPDYKNRTPEELEQLSLLSARKYLEGRSKTVQESVLSLLQDQEGVTSEQIKRIVEGANSTVLRGLLSTEREKTIGFPLANADEIIDTYGKAVKIDTKPQTNDFATPPSILFSPPAEVPESFFPKAVEPPQAQKVARINANCRIAQDELQAQQFMNLGKIAELKNKLVEEIKENLISRELTLGDVEHIITVLPPLVPFIKEAATQMKNEGIISWISNEKSAGEEKVLDENDPMMKMLRDIIALESQIKDFDTTLDALRTRKDVSKQMMISSNQ